MGMTMSLSMTSWNKGWAGENMYSDALPHLDYFENVGLFACAILVIRCAAGSLLLPLPPVRRRIVYSSHRLLEIVFPEHAPLIHNHVEGIGA